MSYAEVVQAVLTLLRGEVLIVYLSPPTSLPPPPPLSLFLYLSHPPLLSLPAFLSSLHIQTEDQALAQLLTHLPLLHPGSTEARKEYMKLLPKVLLGYSEAQNYLDQCRQLLSLALVHPAFPQDDREALSFWLKKLDEKHITIAARKLTPHQQQPPTPTPIPAMPTPVAATSSTFPHKKVHQIKSEESSSALGNGDLMIDGFIGSVSNGFDTPEPPCDSTPPPPHYMHPLEEVEKRVTLPSNHTSYDAFSGGPAFSKYSTLPARPTAQASSSSLLGDDVPAVEWCAGMKGVYAYAHICPRYRCTSVYV